MAKQDRPATQLVGEADHIVHITWSQSGKNAIITVARDERWRDYQQVLLSPSQAEELGTFLARGPDAI
jgi:hypothetical protein